MLTTRILDEGALLRPGATEAAYVGATIRDCRWLGSWSVPTSWLTTYEPRAAFEAVLALSEAGAAITLEAVAMRSGIPVRVLEGFPWDADVPSLVRRLLDLHRRRQLALIAEAVQGAAYDIATDLSDSARRLRDALEEIMS